MVFRKGCLERKPDLKAFPIDITIFHHRKTTMKYASFVIPAMLAVALGVTGCGKSDNKQPAADNKAAQSASAPAKEAPAANVEQAPTEKLNAYSEGYNRMMRGTWGLSGTYERLEKFSARAKTSDNLSLPTMSNLSGAIDSFKKGLAISGGMDDLDAELKPVVEAGEKLLAQQKELEPYFKSKAYKEDDLAKGKAAFPEMLANYEVMIKAMDKVDDLLTTYQRAASEKRLAGFKDKGDMLRYYTEESMLYAQDLLSVFEDPEQAVKSAESYTRADEILSKLEASLEAHRKVIEEEKGKGTSVGSYESVNSNLTSLLGSYRDLRQKKSGNAYNSMTKRYNDAVDSYNRAARFSR